MGHLIRWGRRSRASIDPVLPCGQCGPLEWAEPAWNLPRIVPLLVVAPLLESTMTSVVPISVTSLRGSPIRTVSSSIISSSRATASVSVATLTTPVIPWPTGAPSCRRSSPGISRRWPPILTSRRSPMIGIVGLLPELLVGLGSSLQSRRSPLDISGDAFVMRHTTPSGAQSIRRRVHVVLAVGPSVGVVQYVTAHACRLVRTRSRS